jgi:hypothetical protein
VWGQTPGVNPLGKADISKGLRVADLRLLLPFSRILPMPRRPARTTQADIARAIRAAQQSGAAGVDVHPDGRISILLSTVPGQPALDATLPVVVL